MEEEPNPFVERDLLGSIHDVRPPRATVYLRQVQLPA